MDKLVGIILTSGGKRGDAASDQIIKLYGIKRKGFWYFICGEALTVPRDMYGKDEYHPLSFQELSKIGREHMFGKYCFDKRDGKLVANEKWIDQHFYTISYGRFPTREQYDSAHFEAVKEKWRRRFDTAAFREGRIVIYKTN